MNKIYLDHAATTPVDKDVLEEMQPYFFEKFGNPMSVHGFGVEALEAVDEARKRVADLLNCSEMEVVFTSGATEANNLAIKGIIMSHAGDFQKGDKRPHIITTSFEHHCVLDTCRSLEKDGLAEITYLSVENEGVVSLKDVEDEIRESTILISVMYVNNEIGTVQSISEIGEMLKKKNQRRERKVFFHTDAVQAVNYFDCDVEKLGVDLLSFSGHKIYGPKGIGALFVKKGTSIKRVQDGGDQEHKLRAGTHNVPGIVGMGKAISMISKKQEKKNEEMTKLRDHLIDRILGEIPDSHLNGSRTKRSPSNANFRFDNVEGEGLLLSLDMMGIAVSTGSACSSSTLEPSHVLLALGIKHEESHGSLRLTLGKDTTKEEIDHTVEKIKETIERLRKISGDVLESFK